MHLLVLLQLRERNFVERIRHKWWDERSKCPKPKQSKTGNTKRLDLNNMAGVFLVLVGGVIISLVLVVFEIRCKKLVEYFTSGQVILPGSRKVKCLVCICINNDIMLTTISLLMHWFIFIQKSNKARSERRNCQDNFFASWKCLRENRIFYFFSYCFVLVD